MQIHATTDTATPIRLIALKEAPTAVTFNSPPSTAIYSSVPISDQTRSNARPMIVSHDTRG